MRRRFFVERFEGTSAVLRGDVAHHLGRVLRAQPGQVYELSDGAAVWLARTDRVGPDAVEFTLLEQLPSQQPQLRVALFLAIVKFERFEWSLEKATELGVDEVIPLAAARSEKALVAAAAKRAARWQKIMLESAQQSRRLRPPALRPSARPEAAFRDAEALLAGRAPGPILKILLSEQPAAPPLRKALEPTRGVSGQSLPGEVALVVLAVGPEGGWTDAELLAARQTGFAEASLGVNVLRSETAVVAALAVLHYALGE